MASQKLSPPGTLFLPWTAVIELPKHRQYRPWTYPQAHQYGKALQYCLKRLTYTIFVLKLAIMMEGLQYASIQGLFQFQVSNFISFGARISHRIDPLLYLNNHNLLLRFCPGSWPDKYSACQHGDGNPDIAHWDPSQ